jgi:hypothetical protein
VTPSRRAYESERDTPSCRTEQRVYHKLRSASYTQGGGGDRPRTARDQTSQWKGAKMLRGRSGWQTAMVLVLALVLMLAQFQPVSARWRTEDPGCSGLNQPSGIFESGKLPSPTTSTAPSPPTIPIWQAGKDMDAYFDRWDECLTDEPPPGPPPGDPPPLCQKGERLHVVAPDGTHYLWVCNAEGFYDITRDDHGGRGGPRLAEVFPRVSKITVRADGYTVWVATARGVQPQKVRPGRVKLAYLVGALVHNTQLPREQVDEVTPGFWRSVPRPVLKIGP